MEWPKHGRAILSGWALPLGALAVGARAPRILFRRSQISEQCGYSCWPLFVLVLLFFVYIRRRLGTLDYVSLVMLMGICSRRMYFCASADPKRMKTPSGYAKSARWVLSLIDLVY